MRSSWVYPLTCKPSPFTLTRSVNFEESTTSPVKNTSVLADHRKSVILGRSDRFRRSSQMLKRSLFTGPDLGPVQARCFNYPFLLGLTHRF